MRRLVPVASLMLSLGACAQILGVDDLVYRGEDAALDAGEAAADAPAEAPVTCDAALSSDPKSCGRCFHDCLGAPCNGGLCGATTVATAQNLAPTLATDGARVFYRDLNAIVSCPVGGCDAGEVLAQTSGAPTIVSAGPSLVYWTDGTAVASCAKSGCGQPSLVFDAGPLVLGGLAVSSTSVFAAGSTSLEIALFRSGLDGSGATQISSLANATATGHVAARTPGGVYWLESAPSPRVLYCETTCPSGPSASQPLPAMPVDVAASDLAVYVATSTGVLRVGDALGSTPADFYVGPVRAIAWAAGSLFFIQPGSPDRVVACSTQDNTCTSPTVLYTSPSTSYTLAAIAADASAVYWVEKGDERVLKVSP